MATPAEEVDVDGVAVRLTSPDKVYFPKLGSKGTKRTLFDYYLAVAEPMVAVLRDRPTCSDSPTASRGRRSTRSGCPQSIPTT
jgi:DNA primase